MAQAVQLGSDRILKPGKLRWLRALAWGIALVLLVMLVFALFVGVGYVGGAALSGRPIDQAMQGAPGIVHFVAMSLGAVGGLLAYVGLVRLGENRDASEFALRPAVPELAGGLAVGAAMMALSVGLMLAAGWATIAQSPVESVWGALAMTVESGVLEEVVFRAIVLRLLWRAFGLWPALAISSALFGIVHISNPNASWFAALCIVVEAGIMLGAFYILTGRVWLSIGVHAGWNFTQGWIFGAAVSGTDMFAGGPLKVSPAAHAPDFLSGGMFGPEASLAGLLVGTLVGLLVLRLAWKKGRFSAGPNGEISRQDEVSPEPTEGLAS